MTKAGTQIRAFILENVQNHPRDIAALVQSVFNISRQAVSKHLLALEQDGLLEAEGATRNRSWHLKRQQEENFAYDLGKGLAEDSVWRQDIQPLLEDLSEDAVDIWHYATTEMINNAIDHSAGSFIGVSVKRDPVNAEIDIYDNGVGIFEKIRAALNLEDNRQAVLELSKGKLTTDPANHTGEGIFFTSRVVDEFSILSSGVFVTRYADKDGDWVLETPIDTNEGTLVKIRMKNSPARSLESVFQEYTSNADIPVFDKTVVPVELVRYGKERLVSRSQAKRLLARVDRFRHVILDFKDVDTIGQAFADEVFRVFKHAHPALQLDYIHASPQIEALIKRASTG